MTPNGKMMNRSELEERRLEQEVIIRNVMCIRSVKALRLICVFATEFDGDPIITDEREQKITDFVREFEA